MGISCTVYIDINMTRYGLNYIQMFNLITRIIYKAFVKTTTTTTKILKTLKTTYMTQFQACFTPDDEALLN